VICTAGSGEILLVPCRPYCSAAKILHPLSGPVAR
jgi:hypothetical protein